MLVRKNSPECRRYLKLLERGVVDKHSETGRSVVALHHLWGLLEGLTGWKLLGEERECTA